MVENTHSATTLKEVEDRVAARLETHLIELVGNIQKALGDSLKDLLQELVKNITLLIRAQVQSLTVNILLIFNTIVALG